MATTVAAAAGGVASSPGSAPTGDGSVTDPGAGSGTDAGTTPPGESGEVGLTTAEASAINDLAGVGTPRSILPAGVSAEVTVGVTTELTDPHVGVGFEQTQTVQITAQGLRVDAGYLDARPPTAEFTVRGLPRRAASATSTRLQTAALVYLRWKNDEGESMATTNMTSLDVRPLTGSFGADITGIDLSNPLDDDTVAAVKAAFAEHLVLAFRDQHLSLDQLEAFALQLGAFGETPFITPVDGHPNVLAVVREADEGGALFGGSWHSDWSFQPAPPSATILYGHDVPSAGGDTVFTNQYLAYETLSPGMKRMLEGVNAVHSARRSYGPQGVFGRPDPQSSMHIQGGDEALATQVHPLVRTHPVTGRKLLFINDVYTIGIEDMTGPESKALLDYLLAHSKQVNFLCRVRWERGTVAMWDNRCVQHHAINDYPGRRREMYRITLAGEVPV